MSAFGRLNELGSHVLIAGTQFLSRRKWLRTPSLQREILGEGSHRYRIVRDWCKATRDSHPVNNCHEMVIDSRQRLYLLTDHPQNNVIILDTQGNVLHSWTLNMTGAHGLTLTREGGNEVLWISDPYGARVVKTTLDGKLLQTLPTPRQLGIYGFMMPYAPTQTAVAPNGDIYVADGYGSQQVIQFDAQGKYLRHFGSKGRAESGLDYAHGICIDTRHGPGKEVLLVTSRRASCLKQFSLEGEYLATISLPGGYPCRPVIWEENVLLSLCWSGAHLRPNSGFVAILDKHNQVCSTLGGTAKWDESGQLSELVSDYSTFCHVHDVCADPAGNLYVCQWNAGKIYPIKLERL